MPLHRLFYTALPLGTFLRSSRSVSSRLHLLRMMFSAPRVQDQSPRYFLMRLCRRLYTASRPGNASLPQPPDIATLCSPSSAMLATVTSALPPHVSYYSHHRVSRIMLINMLHMVFLLKRHRCDLVWVQLSQLRSRSHMSVPPMWEHILCAQLLPTRVVHFNAAARVRTAGPG